MSSNPRVVFADNSSINEQTATKLHNLKEFSLENLNDKKNRDYIIMKLDLLENNYWKKIIKSIIEKIRDHNFVIVKGLPFDENNRFFISLMSCIGQPIKYNSRLPVFIREVSPRDGPKPFENFPHTDSPHWPIPNDLTALQCIRKDYGGGGLSKIVPIDDVLDKLHNEGYDNIIKKFRETKIPFLLDRDFGDEGKHFEYVFKQEKHNGNYHTMLRFCRKDTLDCLEKLKVDINNETLENLIILEKAAEDLGQKSQFMVEDGDLLIFDNKRALHSKTTASSNSDRLLKKIKSNIDRARMYNIGD